MQCNDLRAVHKNRLQFKDHQSPILQLRTLILGVVAQPTNKPTITIGTKFKGKMLSFHGVGEPYSINPSMEKISFQRGLALFLHK